MSKCPVCTTVARVIAPGSVEPFVWWGNDVLFKTFKVKTDQNFLVAKIVDPTDFESMKTIEKLSGNFKVSICQLKPVERAEEKELV